MWKDDIIDFDMIKLIYAIMGPTSNVRRCYVMGLFNEELQVHKSRIKDAVIGILTYTTHLLYLTCTYLIKGLIIKTNLSSDSSITLSFLK